MPLLLISVSEDAYSKKKTSKKKRAKKVTRVYNPSQTKATAISLLQTSDELSELAQIDATAVKNRDSDAYKVVPPPNTVIQPADTILSDIELLKTYLSIGDNTDTIGEEGEDAAELAAELAAEDDIKIDTDDFKTLWFAAIGAGSADKTSYGVEKSRIMNTIMDWLGTPYYFGGTTRYAIDCSAWVRAVFFQSDSIVLPRTAREQVNVGRKITREKLEFGDLVFFHTYSKKFASHVGIYLGDDLFAHASSTIGVTVSSLNSTFYATRFIGGRRFSERDLASYKVSGR